MVKRENSSLYSQNNQWQAWFCLTITAKRASHLQVMFSGPVTLHSIPCNLPAVISTSFLAGAITDSALTCFMAENLDLFQIPEIVFFKAKFQLQASEGCHCQKSRLSPLIDNIVIFDILVAGILQSRIIN